MNGHRGQDVPVESPLHVFQSTTDGVCGIDGDQCIVLWNRAAERILGFKAPDVVGRHCYEILGAVDDGGRRVCSRACDVFCAATSSKLVPTASLRVRSRMGRRLCLSVSTFVLPPAWRDEAVLVHVFRDISEDEVLRDAVQRLFVQVSTSASRGRTPASSGGHSIPSELTRREHEVLRLLATGKSTREIADALVVSVSTVRNHVHRILVKLNAHSRLEAVSAAMQNDLL